MDVMSTTRSRLAACAVLAALTLAGCTGGGNGKSTAEGQVDDRTAAGAQSSTAAKSMDELAKKLNISVPDGYMLQPDQVGDTGPSDLEKAVRDDGEADARDVLTRTRFVRGYQRQWNRSEDDEIVSYVYQFADHAGAVEYTNRLTADVGAQTAGVNIARFTVDTIAGSVGVNGSDPNFATSSVTFVKGPYSVQVVVNGSTTTGLETLVSALAEEQYSRL
jgi:hypothetical protein